MIAYFKQGYKLPEGVKISVEHYIDQSKNVIVLKFIADNDVDFDAIRAQSERQNEIQAGQSVAKG